MISLIVPTRNRQAVISVTAPSYFGQDLVDEVIVVDDAGEDSTATVLGKIAADYPGKRLTIVKNPCRLGASQSRNEGVRIATNPYVLFCDDDESLEAGYAARCLAKLHEHGAAAVSGRRIYLQERETHAQALLRFGHGLRRTRPFNRLICEYVNGAEFKGDLALPFTNAVILTRKDLVERHPFDPHYASGNGYREETDYQMNLFTRGHRIIATNACHSFHLPLSQVRSGGQRTARWRQVYWSTRYTAYFFRKYHAAYAERVGLRAPRWVALSAFAGFSVYRSYLRPLLYPAALAVAARLRRRPAGLREAVNG